MGHSGLSLLTLSFSRFDPKEGTASGRADVGLDPLRTSRFGKQGSKTPGRITRQYEAAGVHRAGWWCSCFVGCGASKLFPL